MKITIPPYQRIALVLQGGGALGSYQAGVFEGLADNGIQPDWVAGISIGSLNCAVIAGNAPKDRVEKLKEFWEAICRTPSPLANFLMFASNMYSGSQHGMEMLNSAHLEKMFGSVAAANAIMHGQTNFFVPKKIHEQNCVLSKIQSASRCVQNIDERRRSTMKEGT